ncbi:MAG: TolC family protein [Chlamydiota bacterium]
MRLNRLKMALFACSIALVVSGCNQRPNSKDWCRVRNENNCRDTYCLYSTANIPNHPLTLDEIIQIGLCKNLSLMVKEQEYSIQREVVTRERYNMLPKLIANWENYGRNENTASFSESLVPGVPPAPLSISSEQNIIRWDSGIVWNLVDFGVAFFRSQNESDKVLIAQLEYERLRQNLVLDISRQFWKAIVAKHAIEESTSIMTKALEQQNTLQRQMDAKVISEIQGLRNENQLINIRGQLQAYSGEFHSAMSELALLMGIPASIEFELADVESMGVDVNLCEVDQLEKWALVNRPELFSADLEENIRADEARAAIVQMLPGVELFGGPYHDSNRFLLFNNWLAAGVRATWDLLNIPIYWQEKRIACKRKALAKVNRMALAVGVIAQVHLSYLLHQDNLESYLIAKELESVNKRLLLAAKSEQRQGKLHEADILKYEAEALFAEIDAATKYAEMQNSLEQLNNAIGMPRYFQTDVEYAAIETNHIDFLNEEPQEEIKDTTWTYRVN